eukprot:Polyplicarium_translucidae@DN4167_c0_g1_i1.p1
MENAEANQSAQKMIQLLRRALTAAFLSDGQFVETGIRMVEALSNAASTRGLEGGFEGAGPEAAQLHRWAYSLGKVCGAEPDLQFEFVVSLLMASDAESELKRCNPFLTAEEIHDVFSITAVVMMAVNRRSQTARSLRALSQLLTALKDAEAIRLQGSNEESDAFKKTLAHTTMLVKSAAETLTARRHYVKQERNTNSDVISWSYDPRFLVFEFAYDIL